jgi:crossover junction endodeoxyribonuclease RuvC
MPSKFTDKNNNHPSCQRGDGGDLRNRGLLILGVDPGFGRTGLGVVRLHGSKMEHIWHSCIETPADAPFTERLQTVRNDLTEAVRRFSPDVASVEHLFFQSNVKTAIKVGMARGVILLALADAKLPTVELTPNEIKQTVAGHGAADKKQIQFMVTRLLSLKEVPKPDDAADALAIAIAGGLTYQTQSKISKNSKI